MKRHSLSYLQTKQAPAGKYADGQGLWLCKRSKDAGKWIVRLVIQGRRREMGLGPWPDVSISEARERAAEARKKLRDGIDPIEERSKLRHRPQRMTVEAAIQDCFRARQAELKNDGKAGRWLSPLKTHVIPKIGQRSIEDIDQHVLRTVFDPIWHSKPDAARKAMNRMNLTLKHAAALDLDVDLQAIMKMKALLGKRRHEAKHIPSLPYQDAPEFYRKLVANDSTTALALRFLMLTAARSSEVRFATFDEIQDDAWHLTENRTKTGKAMRVPLSDAALGVAEQARTQSTDQFLFPSPKGGALSENAMSTLMKRAEMTARPHGLRATFRTWAENETDADWETKESSLGHTIGNQVERAYQRSDLFDKRRALMTSWAHFLVGKA